MSEHTSSRVRPIETATGLPWQTLVDAFESAGGSSLSHAELAEAILPVIAERTGNAGWWAQGATVAYEQQIGRRVVGQSSSGDFQVSATRTVAADAAGRHGLRDRVGAAVVAAGTPGEGSAKPHTGAEAKRGPGADGGIGGFTLEGEPRTSDTPKRLYWRCELAHGAKLQASLEPKAVPSGDERTLVTLTVTGLASAEEREAVRTDLKAVLAVL